MSGTGLDYPIAVIEAYGDHTNNPSHRISSVDFGTVHVGDVLHSGYSVGNIAAGFAGPLLGSINPYGDSSELSGSGYTSQTFQIHPAGGFTDYDVTLTAQNAGSLSGDGVWVGYENTAQPFGQAVQITGEVLNYADPHFLVTQGNGSMGLPLTQWGDTSYLDLGEFGRGQHVAPLSVDVLNAAMGPSDLLTGSVATWSSGSLRPHGNNQFSGLDAGQRTGATTTINVGTGRTGWNVAVVDLKSSGSNASGYDAALPDKYLVVTDRVVSS